MSYTPQILQTLPVSFDCAAFERNHPIPAAYQPKNYQIPEEIKEV